MITLNTLQPDRVRVVTFDCYGTLIDWETGIWNAFCEAARHDGVTLERERVIGAYHAIEPQVEAGRFRPYREVLAETARRVAAECGWTISAERAGFLPEVWGRGRRSATRIPRSSGWQAACGWGSCPTSTRDSSTGLPCCLVDFDFWVTADRVESYSPTAH